MAEQTDIGRSPDGSGRSAKPEPLSGVSAADAASVPNAHEVANALFGLFRLCTREAPNSMILSPEMFAARDVLDRMSKAGAEALARDAA